MRYKKNFLIGIAVLFAFGGGMLLGTEIKQEPDAVTMAAPDIVDKTVEEKETEPIPSPAAYTEEETPAPDKEQYLLMLSGESICIYALREDGLTDLVQKMTVDTLQLRQEDYESLCRGITVDSLEEAKSLCEDFIG